MTGSEPTCLTEETVTTVQTQELTLPYPTMMTTISLLSLVKHLHHCSHRASGLTRSPTWGSLLALSLVFLGDLELDALFEDHEVCFAVIADLVILERAIYRRCTPGQPLLSVLRLANRQKCACLLTELIVVVALPLHTGGFTLQLLDLAHTWSDRW